MLLENLELCGLSSTMMAWIGSIPQSKTDKEDAKGPQTKPKTFHGNTGSGSQTTSESLTHYSKFFSHHQKGVILQAFIAFICRDRRKGDKNQPLIVSFMWTALSSIGEAFVLHRHKNLVKMRDRTIRPALIQMIKGYEKHDPLIRRQAALPQIILQQAQKSAVSPWERHHSNILIRAFFFGCTACEYLMVKGSRRNSTIKVTDVRFFKGNSEIQHKKARSFKPLDVWM